jgi:hypothetical protein
MIRRCGSLRIPFFWRKRGATAAAIAAVAELASFFGKKHG